MNEHAALMEQPRAGKIKHRAVHSLEITRRGQTPLARVEMGRVLIVLVFVAWRVAIVV